MESESGQHLILDNAAVSLYVLKKSRDDPEYVCAVGFEPNPSHAAQLIELQTAFGKCGWRAYFFVKTAVSTYSGTTQFFSDNAMGYKVGNREQP